MKNRFWYAVLSFLVAWPLQGAWATPLAGAMPAALALSSSGVAVVAQAGDTASSPSPDHSGADSTGWGGKVTSLAATLGLVALMAKLGLGESFAVPALGLLLLLGTLMVARSLRRTRKPNSEYTPMPQVSTSSAPVMPRAYSPHNVGNDASARPWEAMAAEGDPLPKPMLAAPPEPTPGVPADFDVKTFLAASRDNFIKLQDAWDRADVPSLRAMMTDEMIAQVESQLIERERHAGESSSKTVVEMLEAKLLGIERSAQAYIASVEFSGLLREDPSAGPNPFREIWNITRPQNGSGGWLVAGVQAMQ